MREREKDRQTDRQTKINIMVLISVEIESIHFVWFLHWKGHAVSPLTVMISHFLRVQILTS